MPLSMLRVRGNRILNHVLTLEYDPYNLGEIEKFPDCAYADISKFSIVSFRTRESF
jgi:hypothetical protein